MNCSLGGYAIRRPATLVRNLARTRTGVPSTSRTGIRGSARRAMTGLPKGPKNPNCVPPTDLLTLRAADQSVVPEPNSRFLKAWSPRLRTRNMLNQIPAIDTGEPRILRYVQTYRRSRGRFWIRSLSSVSYGVGSTSSFRKEERSTETRPQDKGVGLHREPHGDAAKKGHIASRIKVALDLGLSEEDLEVIEITLPEAGIIAFEAGFDAWREVAGAGGIGSSAEVFEGGSGRTRTVKAFAHPAHPSKFCRRRVLRRAKPPR